MKKLLPLTLLFAFIQLNSQVTVTIDPTVEYQTIDGFGADGAMKSWTNSGPYYDASFLDLIIDDLGLTINRNEFDPDTNIFDQKQKDWISALKTKADASGEPLNFISTIWTPPGEWKSSHLPINGGSLVPVHYQEFADYCVDLINRYKDSCGVDLMALSISNEPSYEGAYNTCLWTAVEWSEVIGIVGKALDDAGIDTKTFGPEDVVQYIANENWTYQAFENDLVCKQYIDIWGIHAYTDITTPYTGDAAGWAIHRDRLTDQHIPLWMTETSGYDNTWPGGAFDLANTIYYALEDGNVSAWIWWQLGDTVDSDIVLVNNGTPNKKYYASKQYYRYIRPGAKHIESGSDDAEVLATSFKHSEDGRLTTVLINNASTTKTVDLDFGTIAMPGSFQVYRTSSSEDCVDGGTVSGTGISLPAQSVTTLVYEGTNNGPNINKADNMIVVMTDGEQTINLTGIDDGGEGGQTITISAISSAPSVIPNPIITYSSPNATGTLNFTPSTVGNATITVTLSDDGDATGDLNKTLMTFNVKVIPFINVAPTIDSIHDFKVPLGEVASTITFPGVSDGNDGSQNLTVTCESPVSKVLNTVASYTKGDDFITVYYTSKLEATVPVTITIVDDGGIDLGGENTTVMTFNVTVEDGYVFPDEIGEKSLNEEGVVVFPNPAQNTLNIISNTSQFNKIRICDNVGRIILQENCISNVNSSKIDIQSLESGMYIIQLFNDNNKVYSNQFIKE